MRENKIAKKRILELKQSFIEEKKILEINNPDPEKYGDLDIFLISTLNKDYFRLRDSDDCESKLFTTYEELDVYVKKMKKH